MATALMKTSTEGRALRCYMVWRMPGGMHSKFHEALQNDQPRAEYALGLFQQLYAIERRIKDQQLTGDAIVQLRQQEALPVLQTLKTWMETEYPAIVVKKSAIAQAMAYFLPRWEKLCIYTGDARLNIDNNLVENAIRPIAGQKKLSVCRQS